MDYENWFAGKSTDEKDFKLKIYPLLWDEYKYRHSQCWNFTFKITIAAVTLGIVPHSIDSTKLLKLGNLILVCPGLSILLCLLGLYKLNGELALLANIRQLYRELQNEATVSFHEGKSSFRFVIIGYVFCLFLLSVGNFIVVFKFL